MITSCGGGGTERTQTPGKVGIETDGGSTGTITPGTQEFVTATSGSSSFQIFKYEASLISGVLDSKSGLAPGVSINFADAKKACESAGFRLCTDIEWRDACRGPENLLYGFASTAEGPPAVKDTCDVARTENNSPGSLPSLSGSHAACKTNVSEIFDMIGNAAEWTVMTDGTTAKAAGAAFYQTPEQSTCDGELTATGAVGEHMDPTTASSDVGFRCCKDQSVP